MEKTVIGIVSKYDQSFRAKDIEWNLKMAGAEVTLDYVQNTLVEGLAVIYNRIMRRHPDCHRFILMHDDVQINTVGWVRKINELFDNNPEYGIIGLAGSKSLFKTTIVKNPAKKEGDDLPESIVVPDGRWWTDWGAAYGTVIHSLAPRRPNEIRAVFMTGFNNRLSDIEEVAVVDGLLIAVDNTRALNGFDERFTGFHMYDITFCLSNFQENNCKIGVTTNVLAKHRSAGDSNSKAYEEARDKMVELYSHKLPINRLTVMPDNGTDSKEA